MVSLDYDQLGMLDTSLAQRADEASLVGASFCPQSMGIDSDGQLRLGGGTEDILARTMHRHIAASQRILWELGYK